MPNLRKAMPLPQSQWNSFNKDNPRQTERRGNAMAKNAPSESMKKEKNHLNEISKEIVDDNANLRGT